jgi:hypothetical protein
VEDERLQVHKVRHGRGRRRRQDLHAHLLHLQHLPHSTPLSSPPPFLLPLGDCADCSFFMGFWFGGELRLGEAAWQPFFDLDGFGGEIPYFVLLHNLRIWPPN